MIVPGATSSVSRPGAGAGSGTSGCGSFIGGNSGSGVGSSALSMVSGIVSMVLMAFDDIMTVDCSQSLAPQVFRLDLNVFKRLEGLAGNVGC